MYDNIEYGYDPHDDSDFLNIHDNEVWGNGNHGIIASKRCNNVSIQNNTVWNGRNAGIFLHRSSDYAIVKGEYELFVSTKSCQLSTTFQRYPSQLSIATNLASVRLQIHHSDSVFNFLNLREADSVVHSAQC